MVSNYVIISAVHRRPNLTEGWGMHLARYSQCPVVVVGDEVDTKDRLQRHLKSRLVWIPYCNDPLGAKWNRAAEVGALLGRHVVILGSDDFPSPALFDYWENIDTYPELVSLDALYVHDLETVETSHITLQNVQRGSFGTARLYRAASIAQRFSEYGFAWTPSLRSGLDYNLWTHMGQPVATILPTSSDIWCVAVKSVQQIWSYKTLKKRLNMPRAEFMPESLVTFLDWIHS